MTDTPTDRETVERTIRFLEACNRNGYGDMLDGPIELIRALRARAEAAEAEVKRLRETKLAYSGVTYVCPICDIAGCEHMRAALGKGGE